jgi:alkylation response protein AidB-like acyl-CoA dehydrogenase
MDLMLDAEQESIREAVRTMLRDRMPSERVRAVMASESGVDRALWREAGELGWFGLGLAEHAGGAGYGLPEAMLLFTELGRALVAGPWLGSVVAAEALATAPALRTTLDGVLAGTTLVAIVDDPSNTLGATAKLRGRIAGVLDAGVADAFLVLGASTVRFVAAGASGLHVSSERSIDPTRGIGAIEAKGADATVVGHGAALLRRVATVLAAAEAVGVAERTLEMSVEFAKVRQQFGKPIGTFQAIKHRCADMATRTEVARAVVVYAAVAVRDGEPDADFHVHSAKALATDAAIENATDNVQNHGGMGYTWESDAHLYLKRARLLEHTCGSRVAHLDALAAPWRAER